MTMSTKTKAARTAISYCLHDDTDYLPSSLDSLASSAEAASSDIFAFISRLRWHASPGDWQAAAATAEALGATVVLGDWPTELAQRQAAIDHLLSGALCPTEFGNRRIGTAR